MPNSRIFPLAAAMVLATSLSAGGEATYPSKNAVVIDNTTSKFNATVNLRGSFDNDPGVLKDADAKPTCQYQVSGGGVSGVSDFKNITRIVLKPGTTLTLTFSNNLGNYVTTGLVFKSTTAKVQDGCSYDLTIQDESKNFIPLKARRDVDGTATVITVLSDRSTGPKGFDLNGNKIKLKGRDLWN